MGIVSCINSIGGLLILAGCIFYAFMARGNAHGIIGGLAVLSLACPLTESALQSKDSVSVNAII